MAKRGNGEGSISKKSDGTWWGRVTVGYNPNGTQRRKAVYGKTRKEVQDKINVILNDLSKNTYVFDSNILMSEWLDFWLDNYVINHIKTSTRVSYEGHINNHIKPSLGNFKVQKVNTNQVQLFINDRYKSGNVVNNGKLSSKTVKNIYNTLNLALEQAVKNDIISKNPCKAIVLPKDEKKEVRFLSIEEQNRLIMASKNYRLGIVTQLAIWTGMRLGEVLGLKWEDINFNNRTLSVKRTINRLKNYEGTSKTKIVIDTPKTKKAIRTIPLSNVAFESLMAHKQAQDGEIDFAGSSYINDGFIFANELGAPIEPRSYQDTFKLIVDDAGLEDIHFHLLRHSFASNGINLGISPKIVSEILGHADITTTLNIYAHVASDDKRIAMEVINKNLLD